MLRNLSILLLIVLILGSCSSASTPEAERESLISLKFEQKLSSTYDEVIANYRKLDEAWPEAKLLEAGPTDCGKPLHLFVMSANRQFDPERIRKSGKTIVMIMNGIHPGEPDGMEASILVADDILRNHNGMRKLLDDAVVCIIPVYSIGGLLYQDRWHRTNQPEPLNPGYRGNAKNLDLNRDFVKLDTENAKSFVRLFRQWDPDVFLDTHATNGSDHQHVVTYLPAQHNSMPEPVGRFFKETMIPAIYGKMAATPYPMIPYAEYTNQSPEEGIESYVQTPRFSTGYTLLFHSLTQMIENLCYQPYVERVWGSYHFINSMIGFANEHSGQIRQVREEAKLAAKTKKEFALSYTIDSSRFETIEFRGFERGTDISPLTGEVRPIYDYSKPFTTSPAAAGTVRPPSGGIPSGYQGPGENLAGAHAQNPCGGRCERTDPRQGHPRFFRGRFGKPGERGGPSRCQARQRAGGHAGLRRLQGQSLYGPGAQVESDQGRGPQSDGLP
ncbi:MAG: M14 family zinc carboxypeptidase [Bacteroidales bacterium]